MDRGSIVLLANVLDNGRESEDDEAYRRELAAAGEPEWLVDGFASMFASVRESRFEVVSADIPNLTGEAQQPFAEFIRAASPRTA